MAFNLSAGTKERPIVQLQLNQMSGMVSNMLPQDVPEGASPDNADVTYTPGSVASRPCLQKIFAKPLYPLSMRIYGKSYVANNGVIRNLYFYSNGAITVEVVYAPSGSGVVASPGVETLLSQTSAINCKAKSITAFNREYIAISDGQHGQEVPLQFDGTYLDRVSQDGPCAPPQIANLIIPSVLMEGPNAPPTLTITGLFPDQSTGTAFLALNIYIAPGGPSVAVGQVVIISGTGSQWDGQPMTVVQNPGPAGAITTAFYSPLGSPPYVGTGTLTIGSGTANTTMTRVANIVTVETATTHNLQPGYQVQITGVPAAGSVNDPINPTGIGGPITSIVIDNEDFPGIATITTTSPHGLVPQNQVSITGVSGVATGGTSTGSRQGEVVTITTTTPHGLNVGSSVTLSGASDGSFDFSGFVAQVIDPMNFTLIQADGTNSTATGVVVTLNWPLPPGNPTPQYFSVQTAPTPTTFTVAISYGDGTWNSGQVSFGWNGTFYVQSIPTPLSFTYQQYGPSLAPYNYTTAQGTVTPFGQMAPGIHQLRVSFMDRQGYITAPSPPVVNFEANGGQYPSVTGIPIGPSNIVARILEWTGAGGQQFFYIPSTPQVNGQIVGTATQINDNTTTATILDFGDPTLFEAIGTTTPGNTTANQVVLDSSLGFGFFGVRLITYGQRNVVASGEGEGGLLNMGFDGGYLPASPTLPTGWSVGSPGGQIVPSESLNPPRPAGFAWQITVAGGGGASGGLSQPAYEDAYGDPIILGNTQYRLRIWLQPSVIDPTLNFTATLSSAATGFSATAVIGGNAMTTAGSFVEAVFSAFTPLNIPPDLQLSIGSTGTLGLTLNVDEMFLVYNEEPYTNDCLGSYVDNPEAFDGVSGVFGPEDDTRPVMDFAIIRRALYLWTQDPSGRLHLVSNTNVTEPSGWEVDEVASNCGLAGPFALARSQADDSSASGGEEWTAWVSSTGIRIFGGDQPYKISQEIQSDPIINPSGVPDFSSLNPAALIECWALNDPASRNLWFGLPVLGSPTVNLIFPMNYIGLDSAESIAASPPVHLSLAGKMIARDMSRKWTRWRIPMVSGSLMYRAPGLLQTVFMGGATAAGKVFGNCYTLNQAKMTDDDYGLVQPYYVTAALPTDEQKLAFQLPAMGMLETAYFTGTLSWYGNLLVQPYVNVLTKPWSRNLLIPPIPAGAELNWSGGQASGYRFFIKIAIQPFANSTDCSFNIAKLALAVKANARMPLGNNR